MSFIRRLLGGRRKSDPTAGQPDPQPTARRTGPITDWSDGAIDRVMHRVAIFDPSGRTVRVVGTSAYQGTLEVIAGGRTIDGAPEPDHVAILVPQPHNVYDPGAVRVVLSQQTDRPRSAHVGYLSRSDARAYRPILERLAAGGLVAACRASIEGGWHRHGDQGSFGVRLHIDTPADLMGEIDESEWADQVPPAPAGWQPAMPGDAFETVVAGLAPMTGPMTGQTVCFTGDSRGRVAGRLLKRADQERLARAVGLTTHPRVIKSVAVLVVGDSPSRSIKVRQAAEYGTRMMDERDSRRGQSPATAWSADLTATPPWDPGEPLMPGMTR